MIRNNNDNSNNHPGGSSSNYQKHTESAYLRQGNVVIDAIRMSCNTN